MSFNPLDNAAFEIQIQMRSNLPHFLLSLVISMSYLRSYFLTQVVRFTSMFSSKRMSVLVLTFRSLVQVNLSIVI